MDESRKRQHSPEDEEEDKRPREALKRATIDGTAKDGKFDTLTEYQKRPGFGTLGRPVRVEANVYMANFGGSRGQAPLIYHYDIDVQSVIKVANEKKPKELLVKIWEELKLRLKGSDAQKGIEAAAFDFVHNFWTPFKICKDHEKLEHVLTLREAGADRDDERRRFRVTISFAATVDLQTISDFCRGVSQSEHDKDAMLAATQAVNVLFRQEPSKHYKAVGAGGRKFYTDNQSTPISGGGIVYNGFVQSFRPTRDGRPGVQLDTAYSAFVQPGMGDDVAAVLTMGGGRGGGRGGRGGGGRGGGGRGGGPMGPTSIHGMGQSLQTLDTRAIRKLNQILRNAKFTVTYRNTDRVFSIRTITAQSASEIRFLVEGKNGQPDQQVSVADYFREQYNITLRKPRLPCVAYGPRHYIPLELVKLLPFNPIPFTSLSSDQTADMIKVAAKRPQDRASMIQNWRRQLQYENLPQLHAWGINVESSMFQVDARILQPPEVLYKNSGTFPSNGGWNLVGGRNKFLTPGKPLRSWAALSFDRDIGERDLQMFITSLVAKLRANGVIVDNAQPPCLQVDPGAPDNYGHYDGIRKGLRDAAVAIWQSTHLDPQLIVVIEPRKETMFKAEIKRVAAEGLKAPIVTQVLFAQKVRDQRGQDQYLNNVTMKINLKLGGANHTVALARDRLDERTMMMGADVTHPPPARGLIQPSIAVSVAAINGANTIFKPSIRLQEGRVEMIKDLEEMVFNHLTTFKANSRALPEKILMYRDGVSEGQYAQCLDYELPRIKAACRRFDDKYRPRITFVICAKRHHMRFFATNRDDTDGKTGNIRPGLVVDDGVTHPFAFDFYLQAHSGLQGTAKPTHYIVMLDEIGFSADQLQNLTNSLCYTFARATRSVRIVPVAYYADIIATAARDLVYTEDQSDATTVSSGNAGRSTVDFNPRRFVQRFEDDPNFGSVAWFM